MLPKYHILLGFIFSAILFLIFPSINIISAGVIFLSSFLIDVDHYIYYVFKKKDFSLKRAYKWFVEKNNRLSRLGPRKKRKYKFPILFFHNFELIIFLILFSLLNIIFLYILIGFLFHLLLDYLKMIYDKDLLLLKISIIYVLITNKFKKDLKI